jgi:hypothetical protein
MTFFLCIFPQIYLFEYGMWVLIPTWIHGRSSRQHNVVIKVTSDIYVSSHYRVVYHLMDTWCFHTYNEEKIKYNLWCHIWLLCRFYRLFIYVNHNCIVGYSISIGLKKIKLLQRICLWNVYSCWFKDHYFLDKGVICILYFQILRQEENNFLGNCFFGTRTSHIKI